MLQNTESCIYYFKQKGIQNRKLGSCKIIKRPREVASFSRNDSQCLHKTKLPREAADWYSLGAWELLFSRICHLRVNLEVRHCWCPTLTGHPGAGDWALRLCCRKSQCLHNFKSRRKVITVSLPLKSHASACSGHDLTGLQTLAARESGKCHLHSSSPAVRGGTQEKVEMDVQGATPPHEPLAAATLLFNNSLKNWEAI